MVVLARINSPITADERERIRRERHKIVVQRYRRELKMTDSSRPHSDFDTMDRGLALLEFAKQYRKTKKKATLSEVADKFQEYENIIMKTHRTNGKVDL